jgi:anti-sigma B factor antagonist
MDTRSINRKALKACGAGAEPAPVRIGDRTPRGLNAELPGPTVGVVNGRTTILSKVDSSNSQEPVSTEFAIACSELDGRTSVISVKGELDLSTAPRLKWMLLDALQDGRDRLVLDLSETTFMDSTALGVLVVVNRRLGANARMAIVCVQSGVLRIFELSGMDGAFAIFPTLEEGLAYARGPTTGAGGSG